TFHVGPIIKNVPALIAVAAADFNHDSKTDLVAFGRNDTDNFFNLFVYFSNGAGAFTTGPITAPPFRTGENLLTGDFDGDGKADVALINGTCCGTDVVVAYGDGTGKFNSFSTASTETEDLYVGDVNGDHRSDLIGSSIPQQTQ